MSEAGVFRPFPQGKPVEKLTGLDYAVPSLCSDANGDVFVLQNGTILEYSHGETSPFNTLNLPTGASAASCSWDPTTGNLAAVG